MTLKACFRRLDYQPLLGSLLQHNYIDKTTEVSPYCKYDDQIYQLCISCLYLAAAAAAIATEILARKFGRKVVTSLPFIFPPSQVATPCIERCNAMTMPRLVLLRCS